MGRLIAARRATLGLSQQQLADQMGVTQQTIGHWENGDHGPRGARLSRLADILGVTVDELIAGTSARTVAQAAVKAARRPTSTGHARLASVAQMLTADEAEGLALVLAEILRRRDERNGVQSNP